MRGLITAVSPASPRFPSGASEPDRPAKKVLASRLALLPLMALLLPDYSSARQRQSDVAEAGKELQHAPLLTFGRSRRHAVPLAHCVARGARGAQEYA